MNKNNKLLIEKFETAESSGKTLKELGINRDNSHFYNKKIPAIKMEIL